MHACVEYQDGSKFLRAIKKDMKRLEGFSKQGNITPDKYNKIEEDLENGEEVFAYIPLSFVYDEKVEFGNPTSGIHVCGTRYELTKNYELKNIGTKAKPKFIREWKKEEVLYSSNITALEEEILPIDEDNEIVFCEL